jgi:hypothetical protein
VNRVAKCVSFLLAIVLVGFISSCDSLSKVGSGLEGTIIFDVSYPYEAPTVMMDLYPKEMTVVFEKHKIHASLKSSYDMLTTDFIVDHSKKEFVQLLKNMSTRSAMRMNESETAAWFDDIIQYRLEKTPETKQICGYTCSKTIAHPLDASKPSIDIYATTDVGIDDSNWWNPYRGIDGFMMAYEIEQYGICMRMQARQITFEDVEPTEFEIPENYTLVDSNLMKELLADVVETYIKD